MSRGWGQFFMTQRGQFRMSFDNRLFGTFAEPPPDEPLRFGLKGRPVSHNPLTIALAEWVHLARDVRRANGWRAKLQVVLGAP
jgi:hypothetical protein